MWLASPGLGDKPRTTYHSVFGPSTNCNPNQAKNKWSGRREDRRWCKEAAINFQPILFVKEEKKKACSSSLFFFLSAFLPQSACRKGILDPGKASSRLCERSPSRKSFRPIFIHVILPKLLVFVIHVLMGIASLSLGREAAKSKGAAGEWGIDSVKPDPRLAGVHVDRTTYVFAEGRWKDGRNKTSQNSRLGWLWKWSEHGRDKWYIVTDRQEWRNGMQLKLCQGNLYLAYEYCCWSLHFILFRPCATSSSLFLQ